VATAANSFFRVNRLGSTSLLRAGALPPQTLQDRA